MSRRAGGQISRRAGGQMSRWAGYALRILKAHGLRGQELHDVARSTIISRLTYASSAWYGFLSKNLINKVQGVVNRFKRNGYLPADQQDFSEICDTADCKLFKNVICNKHHVLHHLLPPEKPITYNLRNRIHNLTLPLADNSLRKNFIYRQLFKNTY